MENISLIYIPETGRWFKLPSVKREPIATRTEFMEIDEERTQAMELFEKSNLPLGWIIPLLKKPCYCDIHLERLSLEGVWDFEVIFIDDKEKIIPFCIQ